MLTAVSVPESNAIKFLFERGTSSVQVLYRSRTRHLGISSTVGLEMPVSVMRREILLRRDQNSPGLKSRQYLSWQRISCCCLVLPLVLLILLLLLLTEQSYVNNSFKQVKPKQLIKMKRAFLPEYCCALVLPRRKGTWTNWVSKSQMLSSIDTSNVSKESCYYTCTYHRALDNRKTSTGFPDAWKPRVLLLKSDTSWHIHRFNRFIGVCRKKIDVRNGIQLAAIKWIWNELFDLMQVC